MISFLSVCPLPLVLQQQLLNHSAQLPGLPIDKAVRSNRNCHENYFEKETFATAAGRACTLKEETAPGKSENLTKTWGKRNSIAYIQSCITYTRSNWQHEVFLHPRDCLWKNYKRKMETEDVRNYINKSSDLCHNLGEQQYQKSLIITKLSCLLN